jgi:hypothetical protein
MQSLYLDHNKPDLSSYIKDATITSTDGSPSQLLEAMRIRDVEISEKGEAFVERA